MPTADDEFAEFDTDEATFDAMMAAAEPVELVERPAGTTTTITQADQTVFRVTVPAGGSIWPSTSAVSFSGEPATRESGRLSAYRLPPVPEALAS